MTAGATAGSGVTGVTPWWTFQEGAVPAVGQWMVNIGTGNLVVHIDDVDIAERGMDLAFGRTYNSMSQHDFANTDGSVPSVYGNGWTSTADAHMSYNATTNVMTVWDESGARYDYTSDGGTGWLSPAGQRAILKWDGGCGYYWTQKDGTVYYFWSPNYAGCAGSQYAAYNGRLYMIYGRNHNNFIQFNYYWNTDASTISHLDHIVMQHSDGQSLTLQFANYSGYTELSSIIEPNGAHAANFFYDGSGRPNNISEAANNTGWAQQSYGWYGSTYQLNWIANPRWTQGNWGAQGSYTWFSYSGALLSWIQLYGWGNFIPNDNTNQALQPSYAAQAQQLLYTGFTYPNAGETDMSDSYGHAVDRHYDGAGRVTETQAWTGAPNNLWLTTYTTWDQGLNVPTETVDARGNATDYGYDGNANLIWVQEPTVQTSQGGGRPVARFSYDQYNNLLSYCDPQYVWSTGATTCPTTGGTAHYSWTSDNGGDGNEPYGRLTDEYSARGYHRWFSYNTNAQSGGDYGLLTDINSDCVNQSDGTSRCPHTGIAYNSLGLPTYYGAGVGNWSLGYDGLNRLNTVVDPDGVTDCTWYYANGQVSWHESASERAASGAGGQCSALAAPDSTGQEFTFDPDGNLVAQTHHFGNTTTTTNMWYDGAERLVEVQLPQDPNDIFSSWSTRYIYDISNSASSGASGNLMNVQRYIPNTASQTGTTVSAGYAWVPVKEWNYDALDRTLKRLYYSPGAGAMSTDVWSWDTRGAGLLASFSNAAGDSVSYSYDAIGNVTRRDYNSANSIFSGALPSDIMQYDPDNRVAMYDNYEIGPAFYTYDADGNIATYKEPTGGNGTPLGGINGAISDPTTYNYTYYADDMLQQLSASSSVVSSYSQQYSYRIDGLLEAQLSSANWTSSGVANSATYAWNESFTNAGRVTYKSDTITDPCPTGQTCSTRHTMAYNGTSGLPYALSAGYDAYGRISSWAIPSGTYSNWSYDTEGEPTGFSAGNQSFTLGYSTRGELLKEVTNNPPYVNAPPNLTWRSAGGFLYGTSPTCVSSDKQGIERCAVPTLTFDPRNSALLSSNHLFVNYSGYIACCMTTSYQYDAAGRRSGREYDALNRLLKSGSLNYAYGPGTIPVSRNTYTNHSSIGATPIYTTDSSGVLQDLKFGMNSDVVPTDSNWTGLTVYDRDPFGFSAAQHNTTGTSSWTLPDLFSSCDATDMGNLAQGATGFKGTAMGNCAPGGALYPYRTDGYFDGSLTFRGVRTYDVDTQQWSSPDAYQGAADDPISGLGYNYAGNNPAVFDDPSGFAEDCNGAAGCQPGATNCGTNYYYAGGVLTNVTQDDLGCGSSLFDDGFGGGFGGGGYAPGVGMWRGSGRAYCQEGGLPGGVAPPPHGFTPEYAYAVHHGTNLLALYNATIGHGVFNYNQYAPGLGRYRSTANFGLGVYAAGSGIGMGYIFKAIDEIGQTHGLTHDQILQDKQWAADGGNWATQRCRGGYSDSLS